jgi:hypothetical protein
MSVESPIDEIQREPILLTDYERGIAVRTGLREIRALSGFRNSSVMTIGDPKTESAWLIDPNTANGKGVRFSRFTAHDGTLEIFSIIQSRRGKKEVNGKELPATISSQIQWLNLETGLPETNTDIAAERISQALEEIRSIIN